MMQVKIRKTEHYPVYRLAGEDAFIEPSDVPEAQVREWERVLAEYRRVQADMATFWIPD